MSNRWRLLILWIVTAGGVVAVASVDPIAQPASYHDFADTRDVLGIRNFWNVTSNVAFVIAGILGLVSLARGVPPVSPPRLYRAHLTLFVATIVVGFGSAAYHLEPDNFSLLWDRLPMTVAFMAFFAIVVGEHIDVKIGARSLLPLVILGILSVAFWHFTEAQGRGDLRPYVVVQYLPMLLMPLILLLFPLPSGRSRVFWGVLAGYGIAKLFEVLDRRIFEATGAISGHSLKHVAAAGALLLVVRSLGMTGGETRDLP